jgi:hypothetical protein
MDINDDNAYFLCNCIVFPCAVSAPRSGEEKAKVTRLDSRSSDNILHPQARSPTVDMRGS